MNMTLLPSGVPFKLKNSLLESSPFDVDCAIEASNDLEAVKSWLMQYQDSPQTFRAYKKEATRFLLWCAYERGKTLGELKVQDYEKFLQFLSKPPLKWCSAILPNKKGSSSLIKGPLSTSAMKMAVRVLNSLLSFLTEAGYLRANPLRLMKRYQSYAQEQSQVKYQVWSRMLEQDEWEAVQTALKEMPASNPKEVTHKVRTQCLFALLYFLGLRIDEVAHLTWSAFKQRNQRWWVFLEGKGKQKGHIPVNHSLLYFIKAHRIQQEKSPLPIAEELEPVFVSAKTGEAVTARALFEWVKAIGHKAAELFPENREKQRKLQKFSPHWLRHLSASHQDKAGLSLTMIQANHRHKSVQTTQIYLHAEDDARHDAIQKLSLALQPIHQQVAETTRELHISIRGKPLCETIALTHLLHTIEKHILGSIHFQRSKTEETLLHEFKHAYGRPVLWVYSLGVVSDELLKNLSEKIQKVCECRLISSRIQRS